MCGEVTTLRPVILRNGVDIKDPLTTVLGFLEEQWAYDVSEVSGPGSFAEPDLRLANRGGARISAAEIAAILERRPAIERGLRALAPGPSLAATASPGPGAAAIRERRPAIERALRTIAPGASLAGTASSVPWLPLRRLFDAFADIR